MPDLKAGGESQGHMACRAHQQQHAVAMLMRVPPRSQTLPCSLTWLSQPALFHPAKGGFIGPEPQDAPPHMIYVQGTHLDLYPDCLPGKQLQTPSPPGAPPQSKLFMVVLSGKN